MSTTINSSPPKTAYKTSTGFNPGGTAQAFRESGNNERLNEFLNKKKVPGILDFLEGKIHQRLGSV